MDLKNNKRIEAILRHCQNIEKCDKGGFPLNDFYEDRCKKIHIRSNKKLALNFFVVSETTKCFLRFVVLLDCLC